MKKHLTLAVPAAALLLHSHLAQAVVVPEIDSSGAALAIGLTVAIVAMLKEYRKK